MNMDALDQALSDLREHVDGHAVAAEASRGAVLEGIGNVSSAGSSALPWRSLAAATVFVGAGVVAVGYSQNEETRFTARAGIESFAMVASSASDTYAQRGQVLPAMVVEPRVASSAVSRKGSSAPPRKPPPAGAEPLTGRSVPTELADYEVASAVHFGSEGSASALRHWDAFLEKYPAGRYQVEARYNRAVSLVRLNRVDEAKRELAPFASGQHGDYHRRDAARLLNSLSGNMRE